MNYVSFLFLIYVTAACLAYFLFPVVFRKFRSCQWTVLLAASWMFYLLCAGKYFFFLLVTSWTVYLGARLIQKQADLQHQALSGEKKLGREEKKAIRRAFTKRKHRILWAVLLLNFGILAFFKYVPDWIRAASDGEKQRSLLVPIGISFYTFQATGYLIDVCNGNVKAEKSFWKTALFVSFFPQIIQGPIGFWDPVAEQLFAEHRPEWTRIKHGLELILWGYLRKMVLADRLVKDIYLVTDSYAQHSGSMAAVAVLLYAIQLYADFAGGIDISRGIAQILGIDLPENFRQPYLATSINDYWRRWHITLGAWMKKYVFYPLALTPLFAGTGKKGGCNEIRENRLRKACRKGSSGCIVLHCGFPDCRNLARRRGKICGLWPVERRDHFPFHDAGALFPCMEKSTSYPRGSGRLPDFSDSPNISFCVYRLCFRRGEGFWGRDGNSCQNGDACTVEPACSLQ